MLSLGLDICIVFLSWCRALVNLHRGRLHVICHFIFHFNKSVVHECNYTYMYMYYVHVHVHVHLHVQLYMYYILWVTFRCIVHIDKTL